MIRITTLLWIALLVVAGGTVMNVSYEVRRVQRHIAEIAKNAQHEQDTIRVLQAEWTTLNDPQRIDDLAQRHLSLQATPIQRFVALEDIPLKPSEQQLQKIAAETPKAGKDHAPAKKPAPEAKPTRAGPTVVAAARSIPAPRPAPDSVSLILARIEKSE
jgi:cell division protein FtsL